MTDKNPDLEKLLPADLLPPAGSNPLRPPARDPLLELLAAQLPEVPGMPGAVTSDALHHPADIFTSAEPPAIFRPGNTGIMSPHPTFPGIAPPNIPAPPQNPPQPKPPLPSTGGLSAFVPPSIPGTDESPAAPLSSLPPLDPALLSTQPFPPPGEGFPGASAGPAASNVQPRAPQAVPDSVHNILPLLPDAAPSPSDDDAARWREASGAAANPPHSGGAASGSTGNRTPADPTAGRLPEVIVSLHEGHVMARRVLAAMSGKLEDAARELCKTEIHRSFGAFRADMRANFR